MILSDPHILTFAIEDISANKETIEKKDEPCFKNDFPLLPRNDVESVGTYPFLVCLADNVCAPVKWIAHQT